MGKKIVSDPTFAPLVVHMEQPVTIFNAIIAVPDEGSDRSSGGSTDSESFDLEPKAVTNDLHLTH